MSQTMRHGVFLAPYHSLREDPTLALQRDLELMEWLERLGFQEAWIGEHHSAGTEIIDSPELFIAAAAERTKRIKLGTGVVSLPYHNPLNVANRIIQLDHQTRGRVMFGAGPGLLASDAIMMGIDPQVQRDRMAESLDVILRLFRGETVTQKSDWFNLVEARTHLSPYTYPHPEIAVASAVTPSGGRLAGRYGFSMLCVAATDPSGFDALATNWQIACDTAAETGHEMDLDTLRVVAPMHIAETRDQAFENVKFGFQDYLDYVNNNQPRYNVPAGVEPARWYAENKHGVIGTPDDAIELIERLLAKQGNFGAFLHLAHNWADWEQTKRSYELFARYVFPHFAKSNARRTASFDWQTANQAEFAGKRIAAAQATFDKLAPVATEASKNRISRPTKGKEAW